MTIKGALKSDLTNDLVDSVVVKIMSSLLGNYILLISEPYAISSIKLYLKSDFMHSL